MGRKIMINPGWERYKRLTYAPGVRKGNMLFISGMDAALVDPATGKAVVKGDIVEQTKVIYEKIKTVLEEAGASFDDVVKTMDYVTTMEEDYKRTAEVRRQYFGESFPAATGIIVREMAREGVLIEIDAIAVLD